MLKDIRIFKDRQCMLSQDSVMIGGMRKLCQKFLIELLTEQGSMKYLPERGCQFLTRIKHVAKNEFDVLVAFSASRSKLKRNMKSDESKGMSDSERYADAKLDRITLDDGTLTVDVVVKNRAGNVARITTPKIILS